VHALAWCFEHRARAPIFNSREVTLAHVVVTSPETEEEQTGQSRQVFGIGRQRRVVRSLDSSAPFLADFGQTEEARERDPREDLC
jgi:hypothetical protein